jgi:hypothetical protein
MPRVPSRRPYINRWLKCRLELVHRTVKEKEEELAAVHNEIDLLKVCFAIRV